MFKILGGDGREYGPVSGEQLSQWIREGRAGGSTQIQRAGESSWVLLRDLPEFAAKFQAPSPPIGEQPGRLPQLVRIFGALNIGFGVLCLLRLAGSFISLVAVMRQSQPQTTGLFTTSFFVFQVIAIIGAIIRLVSGFGLLRGREWARQMAVYYAAIAIVLGLYGLGRTVFWMATSGAGLRWIGSLSFMANTGFSVLLLVFNVATLLLLRRREARQPSSRG